MWEHEGPTSWFFISVPVEIADEIETLSAARAVGAGPAGFGSVRVEVVIGSTRWRTSLFPDRRRATYLLPVKKAVRRAEGLGDGSVTGVELELVED